MKNRHVRMATAVIGTIAATTTLVGTAPAPAMTLAPSHVTATPTTTTPASGETFRLQGAVWPEGDRVPATIRVRTWRDGQWVQLHGATMHTNMANRYTIRVQLQMRGQRQLRVIGDPDDAGIRTARTTVTVTVH